MKTIILVAAITAAVIGALSLSKTLMEVNKSILLSKEEAKPANIKLTIITKSDCQNCFDLKPRIETLKRLNVKVLEESSFEYRSAEAENLIKELNIDKIPTFIVRGEINKNGLNNYLSENGEIRRDTFVYTNLSPIYIDTKTSQEEGWVSVTILSDDTCEKCSNPQQLIEGLKNGGVKIGEQKEVYFTTSSGRDITRRYGITKLPTLIFSSDINLYPNVKSNWNKIGTVEPDQAFVIRSPQPPYKDIEKNRIFGLVELIYLIDASCQDCYNVRDTQRSILVNRYGVGLGSELSVDITEPAGRYLVEKYKITKIPTILLSDSASLYEGLNRVWKSVGTVESDGRYVFRQLDQLGQVVYRNLESGKIVGEINSQGTLNGGDGKP